MATRKDSVKEHPGGWYGVHTDDKAPPKRMFRTKEEAESLDSLLKVSAERKPAKT